MIHITMIVHSVGIPRETKRRMENAALNAMGENKSSYLVKDALGRIPDSDQKNLKDVKKSVSDTAGAALQNPVGKEVSSMNQQRSICRSTLLTPRIGRTNRRRLNCTTYWSLSHAPIRPT